MRKKIEQIMNKVESGDLAYHDAIEELLLLYNVSGREQLSCDTCVFNTHSWSEDYPCATCCGFDKHQAT